MIKPLIWFRHDLRIRDQPALQGAITPKTNSAIALFIITPQQWKRHGWGAPRVSFLLGSLDVLRQELDALNIPLVVLQCDLFTHVPAIVLQACMEYQCDTVHAGREFGIDEHRRDQVTSRLLQDNDIEFKLHEPQTIIPVDQIRTQTGKSYSVFTPFRRRWETIVRQTTFCTDTPRRISPPNTLQVPTVPKTVDGYEPWPGATQWLAETKHAHKRLEEFLSGTIDHYHSARDRPDIKGTSSLSPWLAVGALSPKTCLHALLNRYGTDMTQWPSGPRAWQGELVWREFYRHVMAANRNVSMGHPMQAWTENIQWRNDSNGFEAWCRGRTGVPIVDAGMKQLVTIGWMHNRVRMITAMFLVKNLLIDWRRGEDYFARMLVDYDFPSNNGGWQWAASCGSDAAPYFRIFNPARQAKIVDPSASYIDFWLSKTEADRPSKPIVDLATSRKRAIEMFKSTYKRWKASTP